LTSENDRNDVFTAQLDGGLSAHIQDFAFQVERGGSQARATGGASTPEGAMKTD